MIISAVALMSYCTSQAQELGVFYSIHFSKTVKSPKGMTAVVGNGFNVGLSYGHYLSKNFSLHVEPNYSWYYTQGRMAKFKGETRAVDRDNDAFILRYQGDQMKEKVTLKQFTIPLMLQYETTGESLRFFVKSGVSYGLHIEDAVATTRMGKLRTSGYYSEYNIELTGPAFVGFGNFNGRTQENQLDFKNRWAYVAEIGVKQRMSDNSSLYVGMYFDIGLNNLVREVDNNNTTAHSALVDYNRDLEDPLILNSVLQNNVE